MNPKEKHVKTTKPKYSIALHPPGDHKERIEWVQKHCISSRIPKQSGVQLHSEVLMRSVKVGRCTRMSFRATTVISRLHPLGPKRPYLLSQEKVKLQNMESAIENY